MSVKSLVKLSRPLAFLQSIGGIPIDGYRGNSSVVWRGYVNGPLKFVDRHPRS
jgi:hypothetical protein